MPDGTVVEVTRYPVKSMGGERLPACRLDRRGLEDDRSWAVYTEDGGIGSGKTTRRFRRVDGLLNYRVRSDTTGPVLTAPDGQILVAGTPAADAALSAALQRRLTLRRESDVSHHDDSPVHLITTPSLRALSALLGEPVDARRFRANLVVDTPGDDFIEDAWNGRELAVGSDVLLRLGPGMPRCVMVSAAQPGLRHHAQVLKTLGTYHDVEFGLMVEVVRAGVIREGDPVHLR